ncbi:transporter substrate-binding domain-containing protein [Rheinheimera sp. 4Y26]|uniref:transporter substrate-binding domain-containing protein n=1 Tax=Rheinheimera sp. 4Y26 TaxID=2977811 RepID=UPI0021B11B18|nr:transporter substrate-binding domain-containing protein [Rheinheimera sp. 4Y26]MCT6700519.1 transporter substrate-binding domain-containing protein [Rheinheimera sp. 4Y26]
MLWANLELILQQKYLRLLMFSLLWVCHFLAAQQWPAAPAPLTTVPFSTAPFAPSQSTAAPLPPILIASSVNQSALTRMIENRLAKAYLALGYQLQVEHLPAGRSLLMSNKGDYDGELFRIKNATANYPNLLLVPQPLTSLALYAFVLDEAQHQHTDAQWQQNPKLRIGYVRGFKMAEQYAFKGSRVAVTTTRQALEMLKQGKVDLMLDDVASVLQVEPDLTAAKLRRLPQVLATEQLFHFLHKKHQALIAPLAAELKKQQTEG